MPEGIPDQAKSAETIRLILRTLAAFTQYLAQLSGLYGSGHGHDGKHRGLQPRHACLAVGAAVAFIDLVMGTYHQRTVAEAPEQEWERPDRDRRIPVNKINIDHTTCNQEVCKSLILVGRAGVEPATIGLKVRLPISSN